VMLMVLVYDYVMVVMMTGVTMTIMIIIIIIGQMSNDDDYKQNALTNLVNGARSCCINSSVLPCGP